MRNLHNPGKILHFVQDDKQEKRYDEDLIGCH